MDGKVKIVSKDVLEYKIINLLKMQSILNSAIQFAEIFLRSENYEKLKIDHDVQINKINAEIELIKAELIEMEK